MADIAPLTPLRFARSELSTCVRPPYDVISEDERGDLLARSPHNVVRLILPQGDRRLEVRQRRRPVRKMAQRRGAGARRPASFLPLRSDLPLPATTAGAPSNPANRRGHAPRFPRLGKARPVPRTRCSLTSAPSPAPRKIGSSSFALPAPTFHRGSCSTAIPRGSSTRPSPTG